MTSVSFFSPSDLSHSSGATVALTFNCCVEIEVPKGAWWAMMLVAEILHLLLYLNFGPAAAFMTVWCSAFRHIQSVCSGAIGRLPYSMQDQG